MKLKQFFFSTVFHPVKRKCTRSCVSKKKGEQSVGVKSSSVVIVEKELPFFVSQSLICTFAKNMIICSKQTITIIK